MSKAGQNEARKNTATFLNGIALLLLGAGCVGQMIAQIHNGHGTVLAI